VIENSIIGLRCVIEPGVTIRNSIVMGADYYSSGHDLAADQRAGRPALGIGADSVIEGAILDKNCRIGRHVRIVNGRKIENQLEDNDTCMIRDGIPIVLKDAVLPDNWTL
jgi:glucose-1-phosphate adenylyltransferase